MRSLVMMSVVAGLTGLIGCAGAPPQRHGTPSALSQPATAEAAFCQHRVPGNACTRCNPQLVAQFKAVGDWCVEHAVPESQCFDCHSNLSFVPLPDLPADADVAQLARVGEDVPSLGAHAVRGKITIFDFYADWCPPCRDVDVHVRRLLSTRRDLALRKLNVVSWDSPLARRHLAKVPNLPYVIVHGRDGAPVRAIAGLDLAALDRAIEEAAR